MKMIGNSKAKQTVAVQLIILTFFAVSAFNLFSYGVATAEVFPLLVCGMAISVSTISIVGVSLYFLQYYLQLNENTIFRNGISLRSRSITLSDIGGYTLDAGDNMTIRNAEGGALMEIHCCYLTDKDRARLVEVIEEYGTIMVLPRRKSIFANLFKGAKI